MSAYAGVYEPTSITLPATPVTQVKFFRETGITTTAAFVKVNFNGPKNHIDIENTGVTNSLEYSFDGTTTHGVLAASTTVEFNKMNMAGVYLKNGAGATTATVRAWVGKS